MRSLLFLSTLLLFLVNIIRNINFDTKLVSQFVDASAMSTYDTPNKFLVDIKFSRLDE